MWSVYYFFLKKILNVFQKKDKKPVLIPDIIFFSSEDFKNGNKIQKSFKEFSEDFFYLHSGEGKKTRDGYSWTHCLYNPGRTNSDYEFKERTLSIPYWSFGCLQTTWISVGAVFFLFYFCFSFFCLVLFPHKTGGVCKCASAIWTLSGVGLTKSCRHHNNTDKILQDQDFCVCGRGSWNLINHGVEAWKIKDGLCFVENGVQGRITLEGTERAIWVHLVSALVFTLTLTKHSHPALTNSPMHFCSFKLWGTILGMGAQLQQEDCYDFDKVTEKIFPNWNKRLEKHVFSHLLYITIFLYYLSE